MDFTNHEFQHGNERLAVGSDARRLLIQNSEEDFTVTTAQEEKFFTSVRKFYQAAVKKMVTKFPFDNSTLSDLEVLDPELKKKKGDDPDYGPIVRLCQTFGPDDLDEEKLKEEWDDYYLMPDHLVPTKDTEGEAVQTDIFWGNVFKLKTALGVPRFPLMKTLYTALLCHPHSNANSERVFTHVRKIHTEYRKTMEVDTLTAYLKVKMNCDMCCYDANPASDMLKTARSATFTYNSQHK